MGVNPETLPLGGTAPASSSRPMSSYTVSIALGALLFFSALLNVAQYSQHSTASHASAALGWGQPINAGPPQTNTFARLEDPRRDGSCESGLVHVCIDEVSAASTAAVAASTTAAAASASLAAAPIVIQQPSQVIQQPSQQVIQQPSQFAASSRDNVARMGTEVDAGAMARSIMDEVEMPREEMPRQEMPREVVREEAPRAGLGEDALLPASSGGARYCRKDTWLLSCLFYKADINDELTDWKSVKSECDKEPLCDGVNKYWTSDLWHISSSGEAPGCDENLRDGNGTDASAFYKENSEGWTLYSGDKSCHVVDEWGNPKP
eukprot:CAMPEP_0197584930 /NCGR_PEP_ID=MMETSP1326-20131121/7395_1 /TAXON_ID=1155430 /ORGANISM="Genus nov. species nov., Strain RCC2288" /LENGTH=320 /DNA_ID=CAMNT_0043149369 /DNA_START=118 /DNA_END=1080 /DNA_ORIENTATION=-